MYLLLKLIIQYPNYVTINNCIHYLWRLLKLNTRVYTLTDMSFPLQLLRIVIGVRKQRGYVEYDFPVFEHLVNGFVTGLSKLRV